MKKYLMCLGLLMLSSCFPAKPSNAIEGLADEVISKKEGISITMQPIDDVKAK